MIFAFIGGVMGVGIGCHIIKFILEYKRNDHKRNIIYIIGSQLTILISCVMTGIMAGRKYEKKIEPEQIVDDDIE